MRKVNYEIEEQTLFTTTIYITNEEAGSACSMRSFTGYNIKDAIRNANKRLNVFGYKISE